MLTSTSNLLSANRRQGEVTISLLQNKSNIDESQIAELGASVARSQDSIESILQANHTELLARVSNVSLEVRRSMQDCSEHLGILVQAVDQVLTKVARACFVFLTHLLLVFPKMFLFLGLLLRIPTCPTNLLQDNIQLEDVLGRLHHLQYQHFRYWKVFRSMLECVFEDLPGWDKILSGNYRILNVKFQDKILCERNWRESVFPGTKLVMSVGISRRTHGFDLCPIPKCHGKAQVREELRRQCSKCGIIFYTGGRTVPLRKDEGDPVRNNFVHEVERVRERLRKMGMLDKPSRNQSRPKEVNATTQLQPPSAREKDPPGEDEQDWNVELNVVGLRIRERWKDRNTPERRDEDREQNQKAGEGKLAQEKDRLAQEKEEQDLLLFRRVHISTTAPSSRLSSIETSNELQTTTITLFQPNTSGGDHSVNVLHDAVLDGNVYHVAQLLQEDHEVDAEAPYHGTALQVAAIVGSVEKTSLLLDPGANPLAQCGVHRNAIYAAALHGHQRIVILLLSSAAENLNGKEPTETKAYETDFESCMNMALYPAAFRGDKASLLSLLSFGADPTTKGENGQYAWEAAASGGHRSCASILLREANRVGLTVEFHGSPSRLSPPGRDSVTFTLFRQCRSDKDSLHVPSSSSEPYQWDVVFDSDSEPMRREKTRNEKRPHATRSDNAFNQAEPDASTTRQSPDSSPPGRSDKDEFAYSQRLGADFPDPPQFPRHPATFECNICSKRFTRAYNLRSHLRTHIDERPFVCTVCGKAFARQNDRQRHETLHSR